MIKVIQRPDRHCTWCGVACLAGLVFHATAADDGSGHAGGQWRCVELLRVTRAG